MSEKLEEHIGSILQILVIGLLGWNLTTTVSLRTEVGVLQAQMSGINASMVQGTNDRYRGTDAARDFASVRLEIGYLEKRLNAVETKLDPNKR